MGIAIVLILAVIALVLTAHFVRGSRPATLPPLTAEERAAIDAAQAVARQHYYNMRRIVAGIQEGTILSRAEVDG